MHFETAYYAGIERAIEKKLPLFEAGAQGEHKLLRGFEPSADVLGALDPPSRARRGDRGLHASARRQAMQHELAEMAKYGPYRTGDGDDDE